jgi:hypothetical protein
MQHSQLRQVLQVETAARRVCKADDALSAGALVPYDSDRRKAVDFLMTLELQQDRWITIATG